jgi:N-acetylglucosamine kinase
VGSVWLSWEYLKPGFVTQLKEGAAKLQRLSLLRLTTSIATGSVYLAAKEINFDLPRDYTDNHEIFFTYNRDQT